MPVGVAVWGRLGCLGLRLNVGEALSLFLLGLGRGVFAMFVMRDPGLNFHLLF